MRLSRRAFLVSGMAAMLGRSSWAAKAPGGKLIWIQLMGGWDGLSVLSPAALRDWKKRREGLLSASEGAGEPAGHLEGIFSLHEDAGPWRSWYEQGELLPVLGLGFPGSRRSHFESQAQWAGRARVGGEETGWGGRLLRRYPVEAIHLGSELPAWLWGGREVSTFESDARGPRQDFFSHAESLWKGEAQHQGLVEAWSSWAELAGEEGAQRRMASRGRRPKTEELKWLGETLSVSQGACLGSMEWPGWDTHTSQGGRSGRLAAELRRLVAGTEVLRASLGEAWSETLVILTSEFGRRIDPNGTGGTDHGRGGLGIIMGGAIRGGRVYAPGLSDPSGNGFSGRDLPCTVHPMQLWASVLTQHWGVRGEELSEILTAEALGDSLDIKLR